MTALTSAARLRFLTNLAIGLAAATLLVGAFTLPPGAERWVGLGVGAGTLLLTAAAFATRGRGAAQRALDGLLALVAVWTIVASRVIELAVNGADAGTVKWLSASAGAALAGLCLVGLLLHELAVERDLRWAAERIWAMTPTSRDLDASFPEPIER